MLDALLDLVLPQECGGCAGPGVRWCGACDSALVAAARRPLGLVAPDPVPYGFPRTAAAAAYDGAVRGALIAHKESGRLGLVRPLAVALAAAVEQVAPPTPFLLVPVPSTRAAVRMRGHDATLRLTRFAAAVLRGRGLPVRPERLLVQRRPVADQAGLDAAQRAANLRAALVVRWTVRGVCVVVVDDVVTSGATLAEAARALTAGGARVAGAATVAATARRTSTRSGPTPVQGPDRGLPSESGAGDGAARRSGAGERRWHG